MTNLDLNDLAKRIHEQNKEMGWWDKPRETGTLLMLVVSKIAEAMEGERKDLMDDHLPHRKMAEVELADAVIRLLDIAGYYKINICDYDDVVILNDYGQEKGSQLLAITALISPLSFSIIKIGYSELIARLNMSATIHHIYLYASLYNYDIDGAMLEKIKYNRTRADHQPENRAKENGKKF